MPHIMASYNASYNELPLNIRTTGGFLSFLFIEKNYSSFLLYFFLIAFRKHGFSCAIKL